MSARCAISVVPLLLGLVGVVACGSETGDLRADSPSATSSPPRLDRSGSRLQLRGYDANGIFAVDSFFDTQLNLPCIPGIASDGVERCVPRDVLPFGPTADGAVSVLDYVDECQTKLITIPKTTCADPARIVVRSSSFDGSRDKADYWRIGASTTPTKIHTPGSSSCLETDPNPANDYHQVGDALPPTAFVAFVRHDVAVSPALHAVVLDGEDGSRLQAADAFIDVARGKPCKVGLGEDGLSRCIPIAGNQYADRMFSDADCEQSVAYTLCPSPRGCDATTVAEQVSSECAPYRFRFYSAGTRVHSAGLRYGEGPFQCGGPIGPQPSSYVAVGRRIDPTTFPALVTSSTTSPGRLVEHTLVAGGVPVQQDAVFDTELDVDCHIEKAADGKFRCLPSRAVAADTNNGFGDPACTKPIVGYSPPCSSPPKYARVVDGAACDPGVRIYALSRAEQIFYRYDGGACMPGGASDGLLVVADEVPASSFVEVTPLTK